MIAFRTTPAKRTRPPPPEPWSGRGQHLRFDADAAYRVGCDELSTLAYAGSTTSSEDNVVCGTEASTPSRVNSRTAGTGLGSENSVGSL